MTTPREVVIDVFIKMNTSFVRLTSFDIFVAQFEEATGESLHDLVTELNEHVPSIHLYVDPSDLILEIAALREDKPPTQASYQRLEPERLLAEWKQVVHGAAFAADFLDQERIFDGDRLPSIAVVRVLAGLAEHLPNSPDAQGKRGSLLRKFVWRAFLTGRYEANAATASFQDFRALRDRLSGGDVDVPLFDETQYPIPTADVLLRARWPKGPRQPRGEASSMSPFGLERTMLLTMPLLLASNCASANITICSPPRSWKRPRSLAAGRSIAL